MIGTILYVWMWISLVGIAAVLPCVMISSYCQEDGQV